MYYGPDIMTKAGITISGLSTDESALVLNIPLAFVNSVGSFLAVTLIDRLGRRFIILRMTPFMAVSWFIAAAGMAFTGDGRTPEQQSTGGIVAAIGVCLFLLTFSTGMSSPPWTINSEIYPLHLIGTANSLAAFTNWITNAFVSEVFKIFTGISVLSEVIVYVVLGIFAIFCFVFTYFFIPETKGKTIEENLVSILGKDYKKKQ